MVAPVQATVQNYVQQAHATYMNAVRMNRLYVGAGAWCEA